MLGLLRSVVGLEVRKVKRVVRCVGALIREGRTAKLVLIGERLGIPPL